MSLIEVGGLRKSYGTREVLKGVDLRVAEGEIVGVLGPNGAGKTTAVECIGGLRVPDDGRISVAGLDPQREERALRQLLGMQLQQSRLPARTTPREALDLFASFYLDPQPTGELLERFGLHEHRDQRFERLSGGQQQRLSVALALIGRPRIAILDELTTGLDPAARRDIWTYLDALADDGTTMILVTHSMEEAAHLCDRVVIIDNGRVVESGPPGELAATADGERITFVPTPPVDLDLLRRLPGVQAVERRDDRVVVLTSTPSPETFETHSALQAVLAALSERGVTAQQLRITTPTLDDAYLRATGRNHER